MVLSTSPALALEDIPSSTTETVILGIAATFGTLPVLVLPPLADVLRARASRVVQA